MALVGYLTAGRPFLPVRMVTATLMLSYTIVCGTPCISMKKFRCASISDRVS